MAEPSLIFPAREFRDRVRRVQTGLRAGALDALLLTTPADIFYFTGFLTRFWESPARPWFLVVPAAGMPVAVIPAIGEALMRRCWISDVRTWPAPDPEDDGVSLLAETLCEVVPTNGRIGVPMGRETHLRMPLADYHRLVRAVAPRAMGDGTDALQRCREIKSDAEIEKLRRICRIAGTAFEDLRGFARAGQPLKAVFREFQARLLAHGADWVSYVAGAAGRDGYEDVISPATSQPLATGDVLMLDTGAVKDGYFCDFNRNLFLGPPSTAAQRVQAALWDVTEDALTSLRPGMRACDLHRMLADGLERRGVRPCPGRLGHGLGLSLTEWPSLTPQDRTELRAGMVLTLEPSAFVDGARFLVHEENLVLRETGAELLSPRAAPLDALALA